MAKQTIIIINEIDRGVLMSTSVIGDVDFETVTLDWDQIGQHPDQIPILYSRAQQLKSPLREQISQRLERSYSSLL